MATLWGWIKEGLKNVTANDLAAADEGADSVQEQDEVLGELSKDEKKLHALNHKLSRQFMDLKNTVSSAGDPSLNLEETAEKLQRLDLQMDANRSLLHLSILTRYPKATSIRKGGKVVGKLKMDEKDPICPHCGERHPSPGHAMPLDLKSEIARVLITAILKG